MFYIVNAGEDHVEEADVILIWFCYVSGVPPPQGSKVSNCGAGHQGEDKKECRLGGILGNMGTELQGETRS